MYFEFFAIPIVFLAVSAFLAVKLIKKGLNKKTAVILHIASVVCMASFCFFFVLGKCRSSAADSEVDRTSVQSANTNSSSYGIGLIAAALAVGIASIGGGVAVASAAPAAIAAMSENPDSVGKSMVCVVFGETIALYGLLIAVFILNKIDQLIIPGS
jgi:V/A-type H+-transporting ATPase subunit K